LGAQPRSQTDVFILSTHHEDRFLPGFRLPTGQTLVVEYKGARDWGAAKSDRDIGELREELSGGKCLFVMVRDKRWDWIEAKLSLC